jgi:ABC-type phosphate/phosphonate transport system substrate-binding protein
VTAPVIANARMYAVTPTVEAAWQALLGHVLAAADVPMTYVPYPAPQPLEHLWARPDLGCVFMCGYPIAMKLADVTPLAAPIPAADWAEGRAVYRSDLIVRADSPYRTLADTFGTTLGWTVAHSHSGFNALRHHLLHYRTPERANLFKCVKGDLVTARRILDAVLASEIEVGPLDAYWHMLIARHLPELTRGVRVVESTMTAPMPAFVAGRAVPHMAVERIREGFASAHRQPWFAALAETLCLQGFAPVDHADFAETLEWDQLARAAGYPLPA